MNSNTKIIGIVIMLIITGFMFKDPIEQSYAISNGAGTVLSDNWWEALNWIKQNTPECATVATYWDPGHFITGIARRPVVFDGASQGSDITVEINGTNVTTARIQDIATSLMTDDEDKAVEILKKFRKPDCPEMYYIASADLIGKSVWWTYFATWKPVTKGVQYSYTIAQGSPRQIPDSNLIAYVYPASDQYSFVIVENNGTLNPYLQQQNQLLPIEKIFYFTSDGTGVMKTDSNASVGGLVWLTPDRGTMIFAPPQIANSMFTRMFFFNGEGLKKFKYVNNWGGEVKLFKIVFNETD